MIDANLTITEGLIIVILAWLCGTAYSIANKDSDGISLSLTITILYGIYRFYNLGCR